MNYTKHNSIEKLKSIWDLQIKTNSLTSYDSLKTLELTNPCSQSYYINSLNEFIIMYKLRLNIFTFIEPFNFSLPLNIIGLPFSVSKAGYSYSNIELFLKSIKGFKLILNSDQDLNLAKGLTLPTCIFNHNFNSFEQYLGSLRSSYRYKVNKALKKSKPINISKLNSNKDFNEGLYNLYLQVYENSKDKLECLPIDFFRSYPSDIFIFSLKNKPIAFVQLCFNSDELIFLFGGFEKSINLKYDLYFNMLIFILKYGINNNFSKIDFGQTAEESKLKLGCIYEHRFMYIHHSNKFLNKLFKILLPRLSYKPYPKIHRVFKE